MGKQLYCYKLVLLQDHLPPSIATKTQIKKMEQVVRFCTFVLNEGWFNCPVATIAPRLHLSLLQNIMQYKIIDFEVAKSVEKAFLRHTWYLVGKMVPLFLWDEDLLEQERKGLKLLPIVVLSTLLNSSTEWGVIGVNPTWQKTEDRSDSRVVWSVCFWIGRLGVPFRVGSNQ